MIKVVRITPVTFLPYITFFSVGPVGSHDLLVSVGDKREREVILCSKAPVRFLAVRTDPEDREPLFQQFIVVIPETACLGRASGSVIFGIKIEYYLFCRQRY